METVHMQRNGSPSVLLVEDNDADVYLVKMSLSKEMPGCAFTVVRDGAEAIHYVKVIEQGLAPVPDLILVDLNLPKRTGREVLIALRACPPVNRSVTILLSSSPLDIVGDAAGDADFFVQKPENLAEVAMMARSIADNYRNATSNSLP
jgi:CheY-like chemotaxis protein